MNQNSHTADALREILATCADPLNRACEEYAKLERELAEVRAALAGEDFASLPSDFPTVRMAHTIRSERDKFLWQVRDTCARAEKAESAASETRRTTSASIDALVDRFLAWPLPASVCSDGCATMPGYPHRSGTNLMTADEARQMFTAIVKPELDAMQAKIDRLMLEYCPDEMTPEQVAEWERHQRPAGPEAEAALSKAISAPCVAATPCQYPDCGCAEARLCAAGEPNEAALNLNRPHRGNHERRDDK